MSNDFGKLTSKTDEFEKANRPAELDEEVYIAVVATFVTGERPEESDKRATPNASNVCRLSRSAFRISARRLIVQNH